MIYVENKKRKLERIEAQYPGAAILDITSSAEKMYARLLSPFFPHYNIPIPFTDGLTATCVEAVWQGLKVFEKSDVDIETFKNDTMRGLKRTSKKFGKILGHRRGVYGDVLFDYLEARKRIYIRSYRWMLENKALYIIERI